MKYLIIIVSIAFLTTPVYAANDARFDFVLGTPAVMEDTTATCTDTATVRYDFTLGTPSPVFDATANCTVAGGGAGPEPLIIWFE